MINARPRHLKASSNAHKRFSRISINCFGGSLGAQQNNKGVARRLMAPPLG